MNLAEIHPNHANRSSNQQQLGSNATISAIRRSHLQLWFRSATPQSTPLQVYDSPSASGNLRRTVRTPRQIISSTIHERPSAYRSRNRKYPPHVRALRLALSTGREAKMTRRGTQRALEVWHAPAKKIAEE